MSHFRSLIINITFCFRNRCHINSMHSSWIRLDSSRFGWHAIVIFWSHISICHTRSMLDDLLLGNKGCSVYALFSNSCLLGHLCHFRCPWLFCAWSESYIDFWWLSWSFHYCWFLLMMAPKVPDPDCFATIINTIANMSIPCDDRLAFSISVQAICINIRCTVAHCIASINPFYIVIKKNFNLPLSWLILLWMRRLPNYAKARALDNALDTSWRCGGHSWYFGCRIYLFHWVYIANSWAFTWRLLVIHYRIHFTFSFYNIIQPLDFIFDLCLILLEPSVTTFVELSSSCQHVIKHFCIGRAVEALQLPYDFILLVEHFGIWLSNILCANKSN